MWENGRLLAESIDIITHKYQVNDLYIIAHSNGGKAAEVAMYSHNKNSKVKKVFALGTPFWGTYLADMSQQWWLNWLWKKTGLNEGGATSTTYYCSNVVRPYFDNLPNNEPKKFIILGGSGFNKGHTLLAPLMIASGSILYLHQGTNDGVAPYKSTLRPNGIYQFKKNEAKLDHIDIALGQYVWKHIKPFLNEEKQYNTSLKSSSPITSITYNAKSNYQIINSENDYDKITLDKGNSKVFLNVYHKNSINNFHLESNNKILIPSQKKHSILTNYNSNYTLENLSNHSKLKSNSGFIAFAHQLNGPIMVYNVSKNEKKMKVSFSNIDSDIKKAKVKAVITKKTDLFGQKIDEEIYIDYFVYDKELNLFTFNTSFFNDGVYSIHINSEHPNFNRDLISGFTIGKLTDVKVKDLNSSKNFIHDLKLKNNNTENYLEITALDKKVNEQLSIKIYTLSGKQIFNSIITRNDGVYKINTSPLTKGFYLVNVHYKNSIKTFKILKK